MRPKYSAMLTIMFAVCSFDIVYAQAPTFHPSSSSSSLWTQPQSGTGSLSAVSSSSGAPTSYSGTGTSFVANSGSTISSSRSLPEFSSDNNVPLQPNFTPLPDPNVELFAHFFTQLLQTSPVLNAIGDFVITDSYSLMYEVSRIILERNNVLDTSLAELAAEAGRDVGVISRDLYYNSMTHMFAKLLSLTNHLTNETVLNYPRTILSYVEDYGIKNGIFDIKSVKKAVTNGILDFATSIGINNNVNLELAFQLFVQELKALASGVVV